VSHSVYSPSESFTSLGFYVFIYSYTGNSSFAEKYILFLPSFLQGFITLSSPVVEVIKIFIVAYFHLHKQLLNLSLLVIIGEVFDIGSVLAELVVRMLPLLRSVFSDLLLHIIEGLKERRARSSRSRSSDGFDGVLDSGGKAVESQVLVKSIS
jgi:hypothetical protein